ncbi:hypothetical protein [Leptospira santarosai]|nr:hypothetical protein [Leptospira santarosai]
MESKIWPEIAERNRRLFAKQRRAIHREQDMAGDRGAKSKALGKAKMSD